jgi:hypothetical protein
MPRIPRQRQRDFDAAYEEARSVDRRTETKAERIARIMRMARAMHGKDSAIVRCCELYADEPADGGAVEFERPRDG